MTKCSAFGGKKNERTSFWGGFTKNGFFSRRKRNGFEGDQYYLRTEETCNL